MAPWNTEVNTHMEVKFKTGNTTGWKIDIKIIFLQYNLILIIRDKDASDSRVVWKKTHSFKNIQNNVTLNIQYKKATAFSSYFSLE